MGDDQAQSSGPGVLLVDDHPLWLETMRKVVHRRDGGTVVGQATDGREAIAMAEELKPDVVLLDVDMPGVSGIEATRRLCQVSPDSKVVILSASDKREDVIAAVQAGAFGYMLKTAGAAEIVEAVQRIHLGELVFPPALAGVLLEEFRRRGQQSTAAGQPARTPSALAVPVPVPAPPPEPDARWLLEGDYWTIVYSGRTARLADLKGLRDIATLLQAPNHEVHVLALVAAREGRVGGDHLSVGEMADAGLGVSADNGVGPVLDARARREYRARIADLREELAEAEAFRDPERAAAARLELEAIVQQLESATGLGGRDRQMGSAAERARVNVTRSIGRAIDRVADAHAELGHHLRRTVRTGTFCAYEPERDPGWTVTVTTR